MSNYRLHPLYKIHNLDSAMGSLWDFYKRHFLILFSTSFIMSLIIQYLSSFLDIQKLQSTTDIELMVSQMQEMIVPIIGISLLSLLFSTILQHYILNMPVEPGSGITNSIVQSFRYYFPFLIIMIMLSFFGVAAIAIGILLLVVGAIFAAIYILSLYFFILPVLMNESTSIGYVMARIFKLLHRKFWQNMGWSAVFLIILIVISVILSALVMVPFSGSIFKNLFNSAEAGSSDFVNSPMFIILSSAVNALTMPLLPIFASILYFNAKADEDSAETIIEEPQEYRPRVEDLYSKPENN